MKNLFSVEGKVALVTGGSRGIGEMIAAGYLANGAKVYISSRKAETCDATAERLSKDYDGNCISIPADLSNLDGIAALVSKIKENESSLDILVNNAGASWGEPIEEYSEKGWDKVMDTNVKGVFFLTQKLLPLLKASGNAEDPARVINIGSIDGIKTGLFDAFSYGPSKAALHHLTRVLAASLVRDHIIVNAIAPGPFESKMMEYTLKNHQSNIEKNLPRGRIGTPEDMVGAVIYLSSRAGAYVTGAIIPVDGGTLVADELWRETAKPY